MNAENLSAGSIRNPQNTENPRSEDYQRGVHVVINTDLLPGIDYTIRSLVASGLHIVKEVEEEDEETTKLFLLPSEDPSSVQETRWMARLFNRTNRPAREIKEDIDDHVNALRTDNHHIRRLDKSYHPR